MKFIQNLSIRNKLLLICLIPLIATLYFLTATMWDEIIKRHNLHRVNNDLDEIEQISDVTPVIIL